MMQLAANLSDSIIGISNHGKMDIERLLHIASRLVSSAYLGVRSEHFSSEKQESKDKLTGLRNYLPTIFYM